MGLKELGKTLRQERNRKGFTLDDVAAKTKVSAAVVEALEEGRGEDLPHPVYVKGFVRTYAAMLSIEGKHLDNLLADGFSDLEQETCYQNPDTLYTSGKKPCRSGRGVERFIIGLLLLGLVAGIVSLSWLLWTRSQQDGALDAVSLDQIAGNDGAAASPANETAPIEVGAEANATDDTRNPDLVRCMEAAEIVAGMLREDYKSGEENPSVEIPAGTSFAFDVGGGEQTLLIQTRDGDCWVGLLIDKDLVKDGLLRAGENGIIRFYKTVQVKMGNPSAAVLYLNGVEQHFELPEKGRSLTLTFPESE